MVQQIWSDITFVTGNDDKFREASAILPDLRRQAIDLPEIQSADPVPIIEAKLHVAAAVIAGPVLVEDVGLYCAGLNGLPGPLVKWFLERLGPVGLVKQVQATGTMAAEARCVIGFRDSATTFFSNGVVQGEIVEPRGTGHGWDSIFKPAGSAKTYGEMMPAEKIACSMRTLALRELQSNLTAFRTKKNRT